MEVIQDVIRKSGFPYQMRVTKMLATDFYTEEEWSYIDEDSNEVRNLDIHASQFLLDEDELKNVKVRPHLDLLIECKQSELPHVFFASESSTFIPGFPFITGLRHRTMRIFTEKRSNSTFSTDIPHCLGLRKFEFCTTGPVWTVTMSKAVRKGKGFDLSGSEAFNSIVHPLVKGLLHFEKITAPGPMRRYFDAHLVVPLCIIDGPMLSATIGPDLEPDLVYTNWARLLRHDASRRYHDHDTNRTFGIDFVHGAFFQDYLKKWLLPLASEFAAATLRHGRILAEGGGMVPTEEDGFNWDGIPSKLVPLNTVAAAKLKAERMLES